MASSLLLYPDPLLNKRAEPVTTFDEKLISIIEAIKATMKEHNAIGLSAAHLGISQRILLVYNDIYINPKLSDPSSDKVFGEEGSISLPGVLAPIERPTAITVTAQDIRGKTFTKRLHDLEARILMHENDQLNGLFFLSRAPRHLRKRLGKKK